MHLLMKSSRTLTQHQFDLLACQRYPSEQSLADATRSEHHKNKCMPQDTIRACVSEHPFCDQLMMHWYVWCE